MNYKKREQKTLRARIERFIQLGKAKHGNDRYDYFLARKEYVNNRTRVHLVCNKCKSEPFLVYPFAHTDKGDNQKGSCPHCYVPKLSIKESRWIPNLINRINAFRDRMFKRHGKRYSYPHLDDEYKNESSKITVVCNKCNSAPYKRRASSLKAKDRYAGCKKCNADDMVETIRSKNRKRQLRNHQTKDLPCKHGFIYKLTNIKNGKFYIGYTNSTVEKRFKAHCDESRKLSRGNKKAKSYLHNAMNLHGFDSFIIEILEEHSDVTPYFLAQREMHYIAMLKPQYNVSPGGEIGRSKIHNKKDSA